LNNNSDDYNDVFKSNSGDGGEASKAPDTSGDHDTAYYAYGPYRNQSDSSDRVEQTAYTQANESVTPVEVTPPRPLRTISYSGNGTFGGGSGGGGAPASSTWAAVPVKKKSAFKGMFASFLAGVVLVGALMWAADYNNWFAKMPFFASGSANEAAPTGGSSGTGTGTAGGDAGGVSKTSFDGIRPDNISQIVEQSSKAVVWIESYAKQKSSSGSNSIYNDPWFRQFFGDQFGSGTQQKDNGQLKQIGMGTGFIFDKSGYILTNQHVIDGADEVKVTVQGYKEPFVAKVLGSSYELDLAALKIENSADFSTLPIGDSGSMKVGDWVVAIGNPYGLDHSVTVGVFSAEGREFSIPDSKGTRNYKNLMQTDAAINPGNSGGPLLNMNGEVIGINTAVSSQAQGIGFAIPSSTINSVVDNLKNNVKIPKQPSPFIGVTLDNVKQEWLEELKLDSTDGAIVADVVRKSPAFQAGIRPYDVIVDVNGDKVKDANALTDKIKTYKVNDTVTIGVMRDGKRIDASVKIGDKNEYETAQQ